MNDAKISSIARQLSEALQDFAYTRKDDDRKIVLQYQFELVRAVREEKKAADIEREQQQEPAKDAG